MIDLYGNEIFVGDIVMLFNTTQKKYGYSTVEVGTDYELRLSWGGGLVERYLERNNAGWQLRKVLAKPDYLPINTGAVYRDLPHGN